MKSAIRILQKPLISLCLLACLPSLAQASSVNIMGNNTELNDMRVSGVWGSSEKITFATSGKYSMLLTDAGLSSARSTGFGSSFSYLGAMLTSSNGAVASATFNRSSTERDRFVSFDITEGEYWLSLFAITDSNENVGTFNMSLLEGDVSPVPLPAGFWFMATSLLGLFSIFRQRKAAKNSMAAA